MKNLFLPNKVEYLPDEKNPNKGEIIIEPCWPGYGTTWGNTLRRVLLTSLRGSAVTAVKIKGVKYEFSTIAGVKEDILDIILNLKSLHLKILKDIEEPIKLTLKVKGEKKVFASDIEKSSEVEIANPELLIATITDKNTVLEMDIWADNGYGWVPSEEKSRDNLIVDTIIVDSIFSPILNVSVKVENMRVGKRTDFDRIYIGIETDGTLSPKNAFLEANSLLKEQFSTLIALSEEIEIIPEKSIKKKSIKKEKKAVVLREKKEKKKLVGSSLKKKIDKKK